MIRLVAALAVIGVTAVILAGSSTADTFELDLELANASGVRAGTLVKVGGATVGEVADISIDKTTDNVLARLELDRDRVKPGAGTRAAISTVNLVGAKFVDLDPGDAARPLEEGTRVPLQTIGVATELDDVLDVLDADTRTRLEIVLNEAGGSFRGRRADLHAAVRGLPPSLAAINDLLGELVTDNSTLERVIVQSDALVSELGADRRAVAQLIDDAGQAMETVSARRAELRDSLRQAPGTLTELTRLLRDLDDTARPLGPAARTLARTAPALDDTLAQLPGFRAAAAPTLREARATAPILTDLAVRARPTVRAARPVIAELRQVLGDSVPVTRAADEGIEDALGLLEGWARTIQARDAVGHAFRGHVTVTRDLIDSLLLRVPASAKRTRKKQPGTPDRLPQPVRAPAGAGEEPRTGKISDLLTPLQESLEKPLKDVQGLLDGVTGALRRGPAPNGSKATPTLLDSPLRP